jgi:hypothetical protein
MKTKSIALKDIVEDDDVLVRTEINSDHVEDLFEALKQGKKLPPLIVFDDGKSLILVDGRHRCIAAKKCNLEVIKAEVHEGSKREAMLFACGTNAEHGLIRTNADKRRVVLKLLTDQEWSKWSDGKIAKGCAVSQVFVTKVRAELTNNGYEFSQIRIGVKGNSFKVNKKTKAKNNNTEKHVDEMPKISDEMEEAEETELDEEKSEAPEGQQLFTNENISKASAAIFNFTKKLLKLNSVIQKDANWSEKRIAKAKSIRNEMDNYLKEIDTCLAKLFD